LIVKDVKELKENKAKLKGKIGIVCQTTQKNSKLKEITDYLKKEGIDFQLNNTICLNTTKKQKEVANLNSDINVLVVIGGLHSSNTTKLAEIGRIKKIRTYHIEKAEDISKNWFKDEVKVFITAGASTPYEETEKAKKIIENFNFGINKKSVII
jgi:4-hydroxy-3-methylbut-2-enyl diphosphate reductase